MKELLKQAFQAGRDFGNVMGTGRPTYGLSFNEWYSENENQALSLPVVIGRLSILADKLKDESDSTIPLPMDVEERRYKQGKQEAYAHAYIELKRLIDDIQWFG